MNRKCTGVFLFLLAVLCAGCGSQNDAGNESVTGSGISGMAVSVEAVTVERDMSEEINALFARMKGTQFTSRNGIYVSDMGDGVLLSAGWVEKNLLWNWRLV